MFKECCSVSNIKYYSLVHEPKPLNMLPNLRKMIDALLWYVPCIDSFQSRSNKLFEDTLFSVPIFNEILESIGLDLKTDVHLLDSNSISEKLVRFYEDSTCIACQKVILTRYSNETWIKAFLRHLRNSIAHGRFTSIDNMVIFFDKKAGKYTSIIKIDIERFNKSAVSLRYFEYYNTYSNDYRTENYLIGRELRKNGFEILDIESNTAIKPDFIAIKDNIQFAIEIKHGSYKAVGFSNKIIVEIENMIHTHSNNEYIYMIIIVRGWLTEKAVEHLKEKNFQVYDKSYLESLFRREL